jgi:DNA invertase Pin-like site-specific DNA recombinase
VFDSYIRVSRVGSRDRESESFISVEEQRRLIEQGARRFGVELSGVEVVELDVSGSRAAKDRGLGELLERAESGNSDGIIVAWQDRLSRGSLLETAETWERLAKAGARLIAAGDGIDSAAPGQELLFNIRAAIARDQWQRYAANFEAAKRNAVDRGVHVSGRVPLGYLRGSDLRLVPDPKAADLIRELFERRVNGEGMSALARWATARGQKLGLRTPDDSPFAISDVGLRMLLRNPVYLGQARQGTHSKEDAHEPLIERRLFDEAQLATNCAVRIGRTGATAGSTLIQGLAECGTCGWKLQVGTDRRGLRLSCRNVHCVARASAQVEPVEYHVLWKLSHLLNSPLAPVAQLDGYMTDKGWVEYEGSWTNVPEWTEQEWVARKDITSEDVQDWTARGLPTARPDASRKQKQSGYERSLRLLEAAEAARDTFLADTETRALVGDGPWRKALENYVARVEEAKARLAEEAKKGMLELSRLDKPLSQAWAGWPIARKRKLIFEMVRRLVIEPAHGKRGIPTAERVRMLFGSDPGVWI